MPDRLKLPKDQKGIASIIIVSILVLLISLVSIGFSRIVNRDVSNAVQDQKAQVANYAAESGINEVVKLMKANDPLAADQTQCNNGLLNKLNSTGGLSGDKSTQYTCVLIDTTPSSLSYQKIQSMTSQVIKLKAGAPMSNIFVTWQSSSGSDSFVSGNKTQLLDEKTWNTNGYTPLLRATLYSVPSSNQLSGAGYSEHTYFLYPSDTSSNDVINLTGPSAIPDGSLVSIGCNRINFQNYPYQSPGTGYCPVVFDGLPNTSDKGSYVYLRVMPIYGAANVIIQAQTTDSVGAGPKINSNLGRNNPSIVTADNSCIPCPNSFFPCNPQNGIAWCNAVPCSVQNTLPYCKNFNAVCYQGFSIAPADTIRGCNISPGGNNSSGGVCSTVPCPSSSSSSSSGGSSSGGSSSGGSSSSGSSSGGGGPGGGGGISFNGVQAVIDVTAKSNDVVKRLQARVDISANSSAEVNNIPEFALRSAYTICKRYIYFDTGELYIDPNSVSNCGGDNGQPPPPPPPGPHPKLITGYFQSSYCSTNLNQIKTGICQAKLIVYGKKLGGGTYICAQTQFYDLPTTGSLTIRADASSCPDNEINNVGSVDVAYNEACDPYTNKYTCYYHHSAGTVTYKYNNQIEKPVPYSLNNGACVPGSGTLVDGSKYNIVCGSPAFSLNGRSYYNLNGSGSLTFKTTNP